MSSRNFKVLEMVGKGAFATVFKVLRKTDGRVYAMKRVNINKMSRKEIQDTLNEVRFLASIRHENIVGFYEAFVENNDSELCIIMEFCGCGDLAQKIERYKRKRQYIDEAIIWGYLVQALKALQVLHGNGICHRDLKAANTFLSEDGSIKIGDMNVSKQLKQGQLKTQIGTPYYMSPEIWNNKPYDERCDIWSLGCMIYELASLRPPFLGDSFPALRRAVILGHFSPLPRAYSDSLQRIISIMLRVNPNERPNTTQLLALQEIASKVELMEAEGFFVAHHQNDNRLIGTIKIPPLLKKLNDALPKPCYPEIRSARGAEVSSVHSEEQKIGKGEKEDDAPSPLPPRPSSKSVLDISYHHVLASLPARKLLAPINLEKSHKKNCPDSILQLPPHSRPSIRPTGNAPKLQHLHIHL